MKRKIFYKVLAASLAGVLLMLVFGVLAVTVNTKNVVRERLKEETELAASLLKEREDFRGFDPYEGDPELRITILDTAGNVLYESDTKGELDNHADREEIQSALAGTPMPVERYSETFSCRMTYYAVQTSLTDGTPVILRLAVRSSHISSYFTAIIPLFILVLMVSVLLSLFLSTLISRSVSQKITEIGDSLRSLNEGCYTPIQTDMSESELFGVLNQINELNGHIHAHIRMADGERVKLNTVLDHVSQSIIAVDHFKHIVFANKQALRMFNGSHHDIGRSLMFLIDQLPLCERIMEHMEEDHAFQYAGEGMQLSVVITKVTSEFLCDELSAIVIITDVTKEKLMEKQKRDFFANASHELKTPITVMQGLSEVLMNKEGMEESSRKQLARIHRESQRLGTLITDMLMLSRLEGGDTPQEPSVLLSLDGMALELLGELSEELKKKSIHAELQGSAHLWGEPRMVYELMENLISNAVKYNRENGTLTVVLSETEERVTLQIKDTGIGIEKEHLPRLCERFYRVDKSHSKRIGGTGLGLAIVKHICAVMDAELSIESEFGVGTTVTVIFKVIP